MPTLKSVMDELKAKGSEKTRKTYIRHGAPSEHVFGVNIADLKVIAKTIKGQQALALQLYETGNMDTMYLAGMLVDGAQMTKKQLQTWVEGAAGIPMISEYTIPWVTVESPYARELALAWIDSKKEHVTASGWNTYGGLLATKPDDALDLAEIEELLNTVIQEIGKAKHRVRYCMNLFVISVGSYIKPLLKQAKATAQQIGTLSVDRDDTDCKVPLATAYIAKIEAAGRIGKKRKTMRC